MDDAARQSAKDEATRFDPAIPIERASTPPASWYTNSAFAALEVETVFRDNWICAGRADQVSAPRSFFAGVLAGQPFVVVRDGDGTLRAFHNVCRHHAAEVAVGEGQCEELVCPYHGWRYGLDGSLLAAPRVGGIEDFDRHSIALEPIAVRAWGPLVFLCLGEPQRSLEEDLAPCERLVEGELRFQARRTYDIACNWKVFVDNYLDGGYHVPILHGSLSSQLDLDGYRTIAYERASLQTCPGGMATEDDVDFAERVGGEALYAWVHPNVMLNRYASILDTNLVLPLGPGACRVVIDYYFLPEALRDPEFIERALAASHRVQEEDVSISESVQRGLASPSYERGRYAPRVETGEYHFHRLLAADLVRSQLSTGR